MNALGTKPPQPPRECRFKTWKRGVESISACPSCDGRGTIIDTPCPDCGGRGRVAHRDSVTVRIPPGIEEDTALRIPGHGLPGPTPDGVPGDAYVAIHTAVDPRFSRRSADLWRREVVTVPDAVLGTTLTVPTLDGEIPLTIPPGTQPGTVLRVPGEGLPRFRGQGRGDLQVSGTVQIPEHVENRERHLYEQLREAATRPSRANSEGSR